MGKRTASEVVPMTPFQKAAMKRARVLLRAAETIGVLTHEKDDSGARLPLNQGVHRRCVL